MKYTELVKAYQIIDVPMPTQAYMCRILDVSSANMSARVKRDGNFKEEEIIKLEQAGNIKIPRDVSDCVTVIDFTEVSASCGYGVLPQVEAKEKISVPKKLITDFSPSKNYSMITAQGNSMEPFIYSNDKLIIEHLNNTPIIDHSVYVFRYKDDLFVKRLSKNIDELIISSDNPAFSDKVVKYDDNINIIGRVVGLFRFT